MLFSFFFSNSSISLCNQIISLLAYVRETHSASIVESAATLYSFEIQLTYVPPTVKTYHVVFLLLSLSHSISESTYPCRVVFEPPKHHAWEFVPIKYRESTLQPTNAIYLNYSYIFSTLPLHVQCLILFTNTLDMYFISSCVLGHISLNSLKWLA